MKNNNIRNKFRKQLANVYALTVLLVSLFEIISYFLLVNFGVEELSLNNRYLWSCVISPIAINVITLTFVRTLIDHTRISDNAKNAVVIVGTLITSFVVAISHKEYIASGCAFVFPMLLSSIFNNKRLLNASFITSLLILVCVGVAFKLDGTGTRTTMLNLFILFGFAIVSYFCGSISINFSKLNYNIIQEQAKSNDKLRDDVLRDQMTGLYNHSAFLNRLNELVDQYNEQNPFCLVMIDIDDFKKINDTYGHDCGDEVLIFLANMLRNFCQIEDTAFRYGGEEFAIIFEQKSIDEVWAIMTVLLDYVRRHRFNFSNSSITFSAGISEYSKGISSDYFFEKTDKALYTAKKEGKNRIVKK